ncbi:hypothetical protein TNIN_87301 [Trichonephila inaurata madagascariensis]|uniref:Uncharacterized protein n=1 Tax=Trichonephila inaurata madagascariensis TaxID=2747483 RepID=A0A8X6YJK9_9ARAC|nr:hypothetical protein TNIN_87301 [Trichonephila inaurata madagascariensis]
MLVYLIIVQQKFSFKPYKLISRQEAKHDEFRDLINSGSQQSYLLKKTAHEMNLKPIEMKNIIRSVFGGSSLQKQNHRVYEIILQNVNSGFSFDIQVLYEPIICGKIPGINKGI